MRSIMRRMRISDNLNRFLTCAVGSVDTWEYNSRSYSVSVSSQIAYTDHASMRFYSLLTLSGLSVQWTFHHVTYSVHSPKPLFSKARCFLSLPRTVFSPSFHPQPHFMGFPQSGEDYTPQLICLFSISASTPNPYTYFQNL